MGEIGLDYHYDFAPREVQREVFRRQIQVATQVGRPVVIHTREADEDTLAILTERGPAVSGVVHCFTGDAMMAERAVGLGLHVSFSGIVTFKKADEIRAVAETAPLDRILVETDSPFLAPVPHRGRPNEPANVVHVGAAVAEAMDRSVAEVAAATLSTTGGFYGIELV